MGWRAPFLFSAALILVGVYIRSSVSESPAFEAIRQNNEEAERPVVDVVRHQWRILLLTIGMKFLQNALFYLYSVFMLSYIVNSLGFDRQVGLNAVVISSLVGFVTLPLWSWLTDRIGRKPVYLFGCIASTLFVIPFFSMAASGSIFLLTLAIVIGLNVLHDSLYGPQAVYFSELYGTKVRLSGASIGYQVGAVLSGGLAPLIATALLAAYGGEPTGVIIYVFILGIVSTGCTFLARETYKDKWESTAH
ncbi:MFS transporter [Brucella sp. 6810]|uniref:MFS transporter n=1 Tax=Brucella sp. 6810 TaxID=2769351 RepID=UPI0021132F58|nr:MFS transporter [Brucella sp. 6810]